MDAQDGLVAPSLRSTQHFLHMLGFASCDGTLGPPAWTCSGGRFGFTLLFEHSFLAILPSALFLLAVPFRIAQLARRKRRVYPNRLVLLKLLACIILLCLQVALVVQWVRLGHLAPSQDVSLAAAALAVVDAVALNILSNLEHNRSVRPSTLLTLYLLATVVFDAIQCRTLWIVDTVHPLAVLASAAVAAKLFVLLLEMQSKSSFLTEDAAALGPEATSGVVSSVLLWWLNPLLARGYRTILSIQSLENLDPLLRSKPLLHRMQHNWRRYRTTGKHALLRTIVVSLKAELAYGALPRAVNTAAKVSQPFLITNVIDYVQKQGTSEAYSKNFGYTLVIASFLVYIGLPISWAVYHQANNRLNTAMRGAITSFILHNAADLPHGAKDSSASLTLITNDTDRIVSSFQMFHELWSIPAEVGIGLWLLARELGIGCVGPAIVVLLSTVATTRLSGYMAAALKLLSEAIQKRISSTSNVLGSMKETKMLGLVQPWTAAITALMDNQIVKSTAHRILFTLMIVLGHVPIKFAPVLTFGVALFILGGDYSDHFTIARAFTAMSILSLVTEPLGQVLFSIPTFFSGLSSVERIHDFIVACESNVTAVNAGVDAKDEADDVYTDNDGSVQTSTTALEGVAAAAQNACVYIDAKDEPVLRDINISIPPDSVTVLAGKVGSGKSVLLRSLLGQLRTTGSFKPLSSGAAYCAQTTWLVNASIQENIIGQSKLDIDWYHKVVTACALDTDFEELPHGDQSLVGSKGISLSGGQKQRISLARAIYSRKASVVVDDVLSGLDWTTQRHVWNRVFGQDGLLRKARSTVIVATHALHLVENVSSVILIGDEKPGHLVQGSLDQLKEETKIQDLILSDRGQSNSAQEQEAAPEKTKPQAKSKSQPTKSAQDRGLAESRAVGDSSVWLYYFKAIGITYTMTTIVLGALVQICFTLPGIWLRIWTEANARDPDASSGFYFGIYTAIESFGLGVLGLMIWFIIVRMGPRSIQRLHVVLLSTVMNAPLQFFVETDTGDILTRFSKDIVIIGGHLPVGFFRMLTGGFGLIFSTILVVAGARYLAVALPFMALSLYAVQKYYLRTSRQMRHLELEASGPLYTHLLETIEGVATIQAFGWETAFRQAGLDRLDDTQKPHYYMLNIQTWLKLVLELMSGALATILIALAVGLPSGTSAGAIGLAMTNVMTVSWALVNVIEAWTMMETCLGAIERMKSFEKNTPREPHTDSPYHPDASWPSTGRVEFNKVSASYLIGDKGERVRALDKVSISIQAGQKVAICGRTGSGKSTMLLALFRLLELDGGCIRVDGVDVAHIEQNVLRPRLISVPQEPLLFPSTVRANLFADVSSANENAPHVRRSDELARECLEKVALLDIIDAKGGLDGDINDLGLSQGQKQLLCLARALMRKHTSAVLVLDEAMSAVDQQTEELMVKVLEEEFSRHTVISVVHRLNTVRKFDSIVLLDKGVAVEVGPPEELLKKDGGRFRALWDGETKKEQDGVDDLL